MLKNMLKKLGYYSFIIFALLAKKALIIGINGQDGFYLKELLESKSYQVIGLSRKAEPAKSIISCNYEDIIELAFILESEKPDEIYNLAAISSVVQCAQDPIGAFKANVLLPIAILEAIKNSSIRDKVKYFQASSVEIFGSDPIQEPQTEQTFANPDSIYGISKLAAFNIIKYYRNQNIFAVNGILYNHESPLRPDNFISKKITKAARKIANKEQDFLAVGNIDRFRDWSHAKDIVYGMYLSLQIDKPDDYIFASGEKHSIREFIELVFLENGIKLFWQGSGLDEVGLDFDTKKILVKKDKLYFREHEKVPIYDQHGNFSKAFNILGWQNKVSFKELIQEISKINN